MYYSILADALTSDTKTLCTHKFGNIYNLPISKDEYLILKLKYKLEISKDKMSVWAEDGDTQDEVLQIDKDILKLILDGRG